MSNENNYSDAVREHIEVLTSAYSLGALTEETDLLEFESLVESGDPHLSKSLEQMLGVSGALALAVPQIAPPASLRASLLDAVKKQAVPTESIQKNINTPKPSTEALRLKTRTKYFIGTSLIAGLLICTLVAMNITNSAKLDRSNDLMKSLLKQTDSLRAVMGESSTKTENDSAGPVTESKNNPLGKRFFSLFNDPDVRLVTLASMPSGSTRQHLFFSPKQKTIYFVYDNAHPMDASKTYELWATTGSKFPVSLGTFRLDPKKDPPVYGFATKLKTLPDSFSISAEHDADHAIFTGSVGKE